MKLAISIIVGLLIALLILKFTNLESYVLAPVGYDRAQDFNPGEDEARIIRAVAAASGTKIDENQARAALEAASPPAGPPPVMALPGTVTPLAAPSPMAAQQIMAQPPAVVQAAEAAKTARAALEAQADAGGATGGAFTGGGGVGSITQITGGGAPLMGGAAIQPVTAGAAGFGTPAPAPAPAPAQAPAPAPRTRRRRAPPPKGPKTRSELILEEIDDILAKLHG